eukprot:3233995-Alexandrium_andersonii.AAC.1
MACSLPRATRKTVQGSCASTKASTCTRTGRPTNQAPTCATRPSAAMASCGGQVGGPGGPLGPHRSPQHRPVDPAGEAVSYTHLTLPTRCSV